MTDLNAIASLRAIYNVTAIGGQYENGVIAAIARTGLGNRTDDCPHLDEVTRKDGVTFCECGVVLEDLSLPCQHDITKANHTIAHGNPPYCTVCDRIAQLDKWPAVVAPVSQGGPSESIRLQYYCAPCMRDVPMEHKNVCPSRDEPTGHSLKDKQQIAEAVKYTHSHMCIDLRGVLRNFRPHEWRGCVTRDDGTVLTPAQVREYFMDELSKGRTVVPFGKPCEGFSYETGCPGHEGAHP